MNLFYFPFRQLLQKPKKYFSNSSADFPLPLLLNFQGIFLQIFKNSIEQLQIDLTSTPLAHLDSQPEFICICLVCCLGVEGVEGVEKALVQLAPEIHLSQLVIPM